HERATHDPSREDWPMTTGPYDQDPDNARDSDPAEGSGVTPPDPASPGDARHGNAQYGDAPYGNEPYGGSPYGQPPQGDSPYGSAPYGDSPYGDPSYGSAPYGDQSYGSASYGYGEPYPTAGYQSYPSTGGGNEMGAAQPGGLGIRFGARIIDHLVVGIPYAIIVFIISAAISNSGGGVTWIVNFIVSKLFAVARCGYFVVFVWNKR